MNWETKQYFNYIGQIKMKFDENDKITAADIVVGGLFVSLIFLYYILITFAIVSIPEPTFFN